MVILPGECGVQYRHLLKPFCASGWGQMAMLIDVGVEKYYVCWKAHVNGLTWARRGRKDTEDIWEDYAVVSVRVKQSQYFQCKSCLCNSHLHDSNRLRDHVREDFLHSGSDSLY